MEINDFLKNFKVGYTFISTVDMPFRDGECNGKICTFSEYKFHNQTVSVCTEQENLLSCITYGNAIMESFYIPENNYGDLLNHTFIDYTDNSFSEIQVSKIYTGRIQELTPELLKELLLIPNKKFAYILSDYVNSYMNKFKKLNSNCNAVYEYYLSIVDLIKDNIRYNDYSPKLKMDNIKQTDFFNKEKAIKLAKEKYNW